MAVSTQPGPAQGKPENQGRAAPGPRGYPIIGALPELLRRGSTLRLLRHAWQTYGEVVRLPFGPIKLYSFVHPDAVKHILIDNRDNYPRSQQHIRRLSATLGDGLFNSEGAHWRRQRHFMQGPFAVKAVAAHAPAMAAAARELVEGWERRWSDGQPDVELSSEMVHLALDALGRSTMGFDTRSAAAAVDHAIPVIVRYVLRHGADPFPIPLWVPTPDNVRFNRAIREMNEIVHETIRVRRLDPNTYAYASDVLSLMLRAQDDWGEGMLERHLRDELMTLYIAGQETTAIALSWLFYEVARHPEVEQRLHEEVDRVLEDDQPTAQTAERLTYTDMVLQETLRLYPPVSMALKDVKADDRVVGYNLPRGSVVVLSPFLTHRHPQFWPDPERFDPERHAPGEAEKRHRFSWFPFHGGYHSCLGAVFAMLEMKITIALIARRFRLRLNPARPARLREVANLRPHGGMHLRLEPRR